MPPEVKNRNTDYIFHVARKEKIEGKKNVSRSLCLRAFFLQSCKQMSRFVMVRGNSG